MIDPSRRHRSLAANPTLIGAATVLLVLVATWLAFNANAGLPFVPTYEVRAVLPDAQEVVVGSEVRIGGVLAGRVDRLDPRRGRDGGTEAVAVLSLDDRLRPLRSDTAVRVQARSLLGLKVIRLTPGARGRPLREGDELAVQRARPTVDVDDAFDVFTAPVRTQVRRGTRGLSEGLAGRGAGFNEVLGHAAPLLGQLESVAATLAAPRAGLADAIVATAQATAALAPVARELTGALGHASTTLDAVATADREVDTALRVLEPTATALQHGVSSARPAVAAARALLADAGPGLREIAPAARSLDDAARLSPAVLRAAAPVLEDVGDVGDELGELVRRPSTNDAILLLDDLMRSLRPTLEHLAPLQLRCNVLGLWTRNIPDVISEGDRNGNWFRILLVLATEEMAASATPAAGLHLTINPQTGQDGECEAGNEVWRPGRTVTVGAPGRQPAATEPTERPAVRGAR